jgi:LuxR family quorum-sensing system transcriptional regulator SolR
MHQAPEVCYADALSGMKSEKLLFRKILTLAEALGVQACVYCIRMPLPLSRPRHAVQSSYPPAWRKLAPYHDAINNGSEAWAQMTADALRGLLELPAYRFTSSDTGLPLQEKAWGWRDARGVVALLAVVLGSDAVDAGKQAAELNRIARAAHAAMAELMITRLMPEAFASLTPRERQVLVWTAEGKSVPEISCILGISVSTVNFHVRNVIAKLRASNRAHAAVKAAVLGIV